MIQHAGTERLLPSSMLSWNVALPCTRSLQSAGSASQRDESIMQHFSNITAYFQAAVRFLPDVNIFRSPG